MTDFDKAVEVGMGIKVKTNTTNFEKIVVVGMRSSSNQEELEGLAGTKRAFVRLLNFCRWSILLLLIVTTLSGEWFLVEKAWAAVRVHSDFFNLALSVVLAGVLTVALFLASEGSTAGWVF